MQNYTLSDLLPQFSLKRIGALWGNLGPDIVKYAVIRHDGKPSAEKGSPCTEDQNKVVTRHGENETILVDYGGGSYLFYREFIDNPPAPISYRPFKNGPEIFCIGTDDRYEALMNVEAGASSCAIHLDENGTFWSDLPELGGKVIHDISEAVLTRSAIYTGQVPRYSIQYGLPPQD